MESPTRLAPVGARCARAVIYASKPGVTSAYCTQGHILDREEPHRRALDVHRGQRSEVRGPSAGLIEELPRLLGQKAVEAAAALGDLEVGVGTG